jgi:hypothetical protein
MALQLKDVVLAKAPDQLTIRGKKFFGIIREKWTNIEMEVGILMAFYFAHYHSFPVFAGSIFDIVLFKTFANPKNLLFNPILRNVITNNPTLCEKIASIEVNYNLG